MLINFNFMKIIYILLNNFFLLVGCDRSGYTGQKIQKEEEEELYYYLQSTPVWVFIS